MLAAGTGSRLRPLTLDAPKCLTVVGGKPILKRLIENLRAQGIQKLIVVTGYLENCIRDFLQEHKDDMQVEYVFNPEYQTTNNIYSLWLARQAIKEPFLLVECDLVFDPSMLEKMLEPNKIAISNILPWMNGTTVELDQNRGVTSFEAGQDLENTTRYKTVNIYSLSLDSWIKVVDRLGGYISGERLGEYYEVVFADMIADGSLNFDAVFFNENRWFEIDRLEDLNAAELMFPAPVQRKQKKHQNGLFDFVPLAAS
ncbi:MAG: phosphocholine cytidylyltransferase family protein [Oceanicoccus sp.]